MQRRVSHHGAVCFALLVSLAASLLLARPAVAQTTDFSAEIKGQQQLPVGCPDGAQLCGDAIIEGFGTAQYRFFLISIQLTGDPCRNYTATARFTLADGSTLTLAEAGVGCGTGKTFFKGNGYGNPRRASGTWEVQDATGQFAGMTSIGDVTRHFAGAHLSSTYTGALDA
ncbi:hypothetical protein EV644_12728 [Kribbella orskensis]|uniref:Uncharacterized protein n=2 Tax=Kribbellaceae TaxID=2726069 RepID=A0ABY2B8Y5_9ACTN|nr:hypothetical protein EV642_12828 [Kribbella sp. VKM Ac-2500]TCO12137.1 hypothetical protein EV644_12728 [Kribbella orskensis]